MQVSKWGNSLAIRLPATVVKALALKEGDEIDVRIAGNREFRLVRNRSRERALEAIARLARPLPPGFHFDREEANRR